MATHDIRSLVGKDVSQNVTAVQWEKTIDFSVTNVVADDLVSFLDLREGFVFDSCDVFLKVAEGASANIDIGISGDTDGFLDGGSVNGTVNAKIESVGASATIASGTYFDANTRVYVKANSTIDAAVIVVVFRGYLLSSLSLA